MKCGKIPKFSIAIKSKPKIKSSTTLDMQRMKFGKIQKFSVVLKIWLKNESVAHSEPAKDKIWQNPEKFWLVLNIWFKNQIFDHSRPAKDEIWQNPDIFSRVENLACTGMDKVRERGAPLPGNDKENWGNCHTLIWRKREEGGRRKRSWRKEKEEKRKKKRQKWRNL